MTESKDRMIVVATLRQDNRITLNREIIQMLDLKKGDKVALIEKSPHDLRLVKLNDAIEE